MRFGSACPWCGDQLLYRGKTVMRKHEVWSCPNCDDPGGSLRVMKATVLPGIDRTLRERGLTAPLGDKILL